MDEMRELSLKELLQAVGLANATGEPLDYAAVAKQNNAREHQVREQAERAWDYGLAVVEVGQGVLDATEPPRLNEAGSQFLETRDGAVPTRVLIMVPHFIDDLNARWALVEGGAELVAKFEQALSAGDGVAMAKSLVPEAFEAAVDEVLAVKLYGASVALMLRLGEGDPAGCVAEEVMAVALLSRAEDWIIEAEGEGSITEDEADAARGELHGIFELFQDDDVLGMFRMQEPSDAAAQDYDPINHQLGKVDQRLEAWFNAFGGVMDVGYLTQDDE